MRKKLKNNSKFNHNRIDFEHLVYYAHLHPAHIVHFDRLIHKTLEYESLKEFEPKSDEELLFYTKSEQ